MNQNAYQSPATTDQPPTGHGFARAFLLPGHLLTALICSALIVAMPMGFVFFLPYLIFIAVVGIRAAKRGRAAATLLSYAIITPLVVVGAALAPVKTTEKILENRLQLPRSEITLAELDDEARFEQLHDWLPGYVHITSPPDASAQRVRFRSKEITLREFVATIEGQSTLRHRFSHCGNGSSILFGGDACFGLYLREQRLPAATQP
jgi:hypothetical protein